VTSGTGEFEFGVDCSTDPVRGSSDGSGGITFLTYPGDFPGGSAMFEVPSESLCTVGELPLEGWSTTVNGVCGTFTLVEVDAGETTTVAFVNTPVSYSTPDPCPPRPDDDD
jgi:hypothetical protein